MGWLYGYLITAEADDEGRFVADAWALSEDIFSSVHGVSEDMVEDALQLLHDRDLIILYVVGGTRYGFLTGWFEHQYIRPSYREESSLPAPPVVLCSWERLTTVYEHYCEYQGKGKTTYEAATRWFGQQDREKQMAVLGIEEPLQPSFPSCAEDAQQERKSCAKATLGRERKGKERKNGVPRTREASGEREPDWNYPASENTPKRLDVDPSDEHLLSCEPTALRGLIAELRGGVWSVHQRQQWCVALERPIRDEHTDVDADEMLDLLRENVPDVADRPDAWLRRMLARKGAAKRDASSGRGMAPVSDWASRKRRKEAQQKGRGNDG